VDDAGVCRDPILCIHDLGNTLGTTRNYLLLYGNHTLDLTAWKTASVWKDERRCVADLQMISNNSRALRWAARSWSVV
jgi:hypothetical protein